MSKSTPFSPRQGVIVGLLLVVAGLIFFLATFDIGPLGTADIKGPPWLGAAAGGVFMAGGVSLMVGGSSPMVSALLGLVIVGGLAAIGNWIAFGAGERVCSGSVSLPWFTQTEQSSGLGCRIPFGFGALIVDAFLLAVMAQLAQKAAGGPPRLEWLQKLAKGLLSVSLSPLLALLFVLVIGRAGFGALKARILTGAWPRNESFLKRRNEKKQG